MPQITTGIKSILSHSEVYNAFQRLLGSHRARDIIVSQYITPKSSDKVLDIGCGTAEILNHLPDNIQYTGFDLSKKYIISAQNKHKSNAIFYAKPLTETTLNHNNCFDIVIAIGLVHHLDDHEVIDLFKIAKQALNKSGIFFSVDPCYITGQSLISKLFVNLDRGKNIRKHDDYKQLAEQVFNNATVYHRNDLLFIPYDHTIMICK